jgi:hypothetical protein
MPRKNIPKFYSDQPLCHGKRRYDSESQAQRVAEEQGLLNFAEDLKLSVYRCHICTGWHLTRRQTNV